MTVEEANKVLEQADKLAGEEEISAAIERMANEITNRLSLKQPVVYVVMNGGLIFAGQILTKLLFPLEVGYLHATRYGSNTVGSEVSWLAKPEHDLSGRTILLLDDILDEGVTLLAIAEHCRRQGASEVLTAVLVDKRHARKAVPGLTADFTGIHTEDRFLFGYGLDYHGYWRNAPGIYALKMDNA